MRFLAEFDNAVLSYADRTRIIAERDRARLFTKNGIIPGAVLLDGMVAARWRMDRAAKDAAILTIVPFRHRSKHDVGVVTAEGHRLLQAATPASSAREVGVVTAEGHRLLQAATPASSAREVVVVTDSDQISQ